MAPWPGGVRDQPFVGIDQGSFGSRMIRAPRPTWEAPRRKHAEVWAGRSTWRPRAGRRFERTPVLCVSTSREALLRCVQPSPLKRRTLPRYCRDGAAGSGGLLGGRSMRAVCFSLVVFVLGEGLAGPAHADDFMEGWLGPP